MIIRRFVTALRQQDWGTAVLDFVIVVVGIFVGLRVDSWNDTRLDRIYERQMLSNLHEEFGVTLSRGQFMLSRLLNAKESTGRVIDAIRSGTRPVDEASFLRDLYQANWVFDAPTGSTTYAELVATGGVSKLEDKRIRDALNRYTVRSRHYEGNLQLAREITLSPDSVYMTAVYGSTDTRTWDSPAAVIKYDWEKLQFASGELQSWQAIQDNLSSVYSQVLEAAEEVLELTKKTE